MGIPNEFSALSAIRGGGPLLEKLRSWQNDPVMQRIQPTGLPAVYGDEDFEMGESTVHTITAGILLYGWGFHFAAQSAYRVFGNLNLYYSDDDPTEYLSPDVMVVKATRALPAQPTSYRIGPRAPAPLLVGEVLSPRTWQQGDLNRKPIIYAELGIEEYLLTDVTGEMLKERLLLLRRKPDGRWVDEQDEDGGITSRLGFRVVLEADGQLRVLDGPTGKRYARPEEAQEAADHLATAQERIRTLEEELARLRGTAPEGEKAARKGKGRRRKS
jgi:Uma2 family endonuclease